jgi:NAD(P)-dependent dehydrogenase (short-subunit alcohol dehydrogenase family)
VPLRAGGIIWITDDGSLLTEAVCSRLRARGYRPRVIEVEETPPPVADPDLCGLIVLASPYRRETECLAGAFRVVRAAGPALQASAQQGGAALVAVSRLDGRFGVTGLVLEIEPTSGAVAGLAKTAGQEWPGVACKALDLDRAATSSEEAAGWIVAELHTRGPSEVGLGPEGRTGIELQPAPLPCWTRGSTPRLGRGDLVVISGGARGITAEVAVALAESFQPRLVLLGRSPAPGPEEGWLADCHDEAEVKRALLVHDEGRRAPQALGEAARQVLAQREIRNTLRRITAAGSKVEYRSVDVRDRGGVREAMAQVRDEFGAVRGLIHGAGVLADRRIVDLTDPQFDLVWDTKVKGLHHLVEAIDPDSLAFLAVFSSSSARFGRAGQAAYAAANEYLNKWAQQAALRLPRCRVISFNWGPWAGGMVTDTLRPMFEREGLTLIPLQTGARLVIDEIQTPQTGPRPVEILVWAERQATGTPVPPPMPGGTPAARVLRELEPAFVRAVDLKSLPILGDHVIEGNAVLPMAMILEWVAEGALHRNPGLVVCGVDHLRLLKGVILSQRRPATIEVLAGKAVRSGADFIVPVEVRGMGNQGREVIHARAEVVLGEHYPNESRRLRDQVLTRYPLARDEIYTSVLFHGPALQGIEQVEGCSERAIAGWVLAAPEPAQWMERPWRSQWLTDPLAIDCAFQLVVLWSREQLGANSLPTAVGRYRQYRAGFGDGSLRVLAEIRQAGTARAVADIEILDAEGQLVARLEAYECVVNSSLNQAFRRNQLTAHSSVVPS